MPAGQSNLKMLIGTLAYQKLLLPLLSAIVFLLGGSSSYTSTDKTNNNKYT